MVYSDSMIYSIFLYVCLYVNSDGNIPTIRVMHIKNNHLCYVTMCVHLMNSQPQALQQLPVSVVNLVYDVQ